LTPKATSRLSRRIGVCFKDQNGNQPKSIASSQVLQGRKSYGSPAGNALTLTPDYWNDLSVENQRLSCESNRGFQNDDLVTLTTSLSTASSSPEARRAQGPDGTLDSLPQASSGNYRRHAPSVAANTSAFDTVWARNRLVLASLL